MMLFYAAVFCYLLHISRCTHLSFPPNFKFGSATSAYQIEGGWNADGKGENIWDRFVHEYEHRFRSNATGDIAADSYRLWKEDVKVAVNLGLKFYRFSINWPRILPSGFDNEVNKAGVQYYSDLIDGLLAEGIEPIVTLYHWELPVKIADLGGWANPQIVKWFGDYARVIYSLYADRVKTWLTVNEASVVCDFFYNTGTYAPGIKEPEFAPFLCNKHIMLAHAMAYRIFDQEFRPKYPGRVSLANNVLWIEPASPEDHELAELGRHYQTGRYSHQVFSKKGGWPPIVEKVMLKYSLKQGYKESRLPAFTKKEIDFMKGTADFYGMNHYTTYTIRPLEPNEDAGPWFITGSPEINAKLESPSGTTFGGAAILPVYPKGIRRQLNWLKHHYGDIDILITENGYSSKGYQLQDHGRVDYIKEYLEQVLLAIKVDNVSVTGYSVWSLIDAFEWVDGYNLKFGLTEINFEDPSRPRTPRLSSVYYGCVIKYHSLDVPESCFEAKSSIRYKRTNGNGATTSAAYGEHLSYMISLCLVFVFTFV